MSKLFKLKKWLTVPDAAKHLTTVFGEEVTEADVLRFALDGELKLSIQLVNGAYGRPCVPVNIEELEWDEMPNLCGVGVLKIPKHGRIWQDGKGVFQVLKGVTQLDDSVWDLPMTGGERVDVEFRYQLLTNGPEVTTISLEGVLIECTNGDLFEVQTRYARSKQDILTKPFLHPDDFHAAGGLPDDGVFVVRIGALTDFIQSVNEEQPITEKPLGTTERNTLLTIIAAMAKEAKLNIDPPGKAAGYIEGLTAQLGARVSKRAIEDHLKKIPDALGTRMK
jgi:hypothetical protein